MGGILASLTTTLCNIFFSTAKNIVRIIRQSWASLVEATKIMLFNPDCLPFGERFRATAKVISTGASIVVGTLVNDLVSKAGFATIPVVGNIIVTFCGTFVTGIMSCSLLYLLDNNKKINKLINVLNTIPTIEDIVVYYKYQATILEEYCAKLLEIDIERFNKETRIFSDAVAFLENAHDQKDLNFALNTIYKRCGFQSPYGNYNNINSFMADKTAVLSFK